MSEILKGDGWYTYLRVTYTFRKIRFSKRKDFLEIIPSD